MSLYTIWSIFVYFILIGSSVLIVEEIKFLSVFFSLFFIIYIYCYFFNIIIRLFSQVTDPILKIILLETSLYIFHLSLHKKKCNVERYTFSMLNTLSDLQTKTLGYYIFACFIFHNSISGRFLSSHS